MKYLEMIVSLLHKGHMVKSQRGKAGGYKLVKKPAEYTIGSILKLTEGTLAPVGCLEEGAEKCDRATECITLPLWKKLDDQIDEYLESVTLEDVCEPYLMQMGMLTRTPRGRCVTRLAYEHLGLKAPETGSPEDNGQQSLF